MTPTQIDVAAKAMWESEPIIYNWGPQERHRVSWEDAVERKLVGVAIFRAFAKAALTAATGVGETTSEHIARDMRSGIFPKRSEPLSVVDVTIERCAQVAESHIYFCEGCDDTHRDIAAQIRALKSESKP